ncbi:MAG: FAD:protein FMN transferase [Candidatus Margulisiibacteriota bacterium]
MTVCVFIAFFIFGCAIKPSDQISERSFFVMGTVCDIKVISSDPKKAQEALRMLYGSLKNTEAEYNFYDNKSRTSEINKKAAHNFTVLSGDESMLIKKSLELSVLTRGAYDITFNPLWELWKQCGKNNRLPAASEIRAAKERIGYKKIILSPDGRSIKYSSRGIKINLGGIAKGLALLNCKDTAKKIGAENVMVNLGGDILALGIGRGEGWTIAVQDPYDPDKIAKKIKVRDKIVLTSGIYQRYVTIKGKRYHHIIDANTGFPAGDFASVTIIEDAKREKYVPSLAVFLMGKGKAVEYLGEHPSIGYFIIERDGRVIANI